MWLAQVPIPELNTDSDIVAGLLAIGIIISAAYILWQQVSKSRLSELDTVVTRLDRESVRLNNRLVAVQEELDRCVSARKKATDHIETLQAEMHALEIEIEGLKYGPR